MAIFIYSRVSTDKQQTENQLHRLRELYPSGEIIQETASGFKDKPVLNALLARLRRDDVLVVAALDRLGRRASRALVLIEDLTRRGIKVISQREGIDTATSSGKFVATCMFGLAEMERNLISERTKATLARLKAEGKHVGRPKKFNEALIQSIFYHRANGLNIRQISGLTGASTATVCRALKVAV